MLAKKRRDAQVAALQTRNSDLSAQLAKAAKQKLAAQEKAAYAATALTALSSAVKDAIARLDPLPITLDARSNPEIDARAQSHRIALQIATLNQEKADLAAKLEKNIAASKERESDLAEKNANLINKCAELEHLFETHSSVSEHKELLAELKKQKDTNKRLAESNSALSGQIQSLNQNILLLKDKVKESGKSYRAQLEATADKMEQLVREKNQLEAHCQAIQSKLKLFTLKEQADRFDLRNHNNNNNTDSHTPSLKRSTGPYSHNRSPRTVLFETNGRLHRNQSASRDHGNILEQDFGNEFANDSSILLSLDDAPHQENISSSTLLHFAQQEKSFARRFDEKFDEHMEELEREFDEL